MVAAYLTRAELAAAKLGTFTTGIADADLDKFLQRACARVDSMVGCTFESGTYTEALLTTQPASAAIAVDGSVLLTPRRARPILTVTSLGYRLRSVGNQGSLTTLTVSANTYLILPNEFGDGMTIQVFGADWGAYRSARSTVEFDLVYTAGYAVGSEPPWLKEAALEMAAYLLKGRLDPAMAQGEDGQIAVADFSATGGHLKKCRDALQGHGRIA